ncbi:MAG: alanine--tRNA ligase [Candidatus Melainabacteria bacterium LEY3_CP_29_8]|nr:MAG: alanine--tRNA ligase [Candidatus Melainabacteria bacterium LEY3_CP_29_8]
MEKLTGEQIRSMFLNYFKDKHNCTIVKSSSLIPDNPTVLLTTAGMLQFVPIFLGLEKAPYNPPRATSCQKCARAGGKDSDIENVGRTPRHHTFFEMLGNFSFGDYFKKEVIPWAWEFVTEYLKLDKDRLYITIYKDDDEAFRIWHEVVGIDEKRIIRKGKKDNFWGPPGPTGPCGPCTEIHYDLGEEYKCSSDCSISTCECDRWVEIWNLVFMELFQDENGNLSPLEKKNVDTGMGLERIAMVCQGKSSTFETDLLLPILNEVSKLANVKYNDSEKTDISLRIIADHIRCCTFMVGDGLTPGNEGRNYVLRMILRRALRHAMILGIKLPNLYNLVSFVISKYKNVYPELEEKKDKIISVIKEEEEKFQGTLQRGEKLLNELLNQNNKIISGENAFKLYDTFGFPLELTVEIANENNVKVDIEGFNRCMKEQKQRAKDSAQKVVLTDDLVYVEIENKYGATNFTGYQNLFENNSKVVAIVENKNDANILDIILDKTPFYAISGGQACDSGRIYNENFEAKVVNVFKVNKLFVHRVKVLKGEVDVDDIVTSQIDTEKRQNTACHHTLAHLLQAALIKVLGNEVHQMGSGVEESRTRFDFSYSHALTQKQLFEVENIVNNWVKENLVQTTQIMDINEAKKTGAMALFDEKYDSQVRVVKIGDISCELCGGTHSKNTNELKYVKIIQESAISSGVRRIEACCGNYAINYINEKACEMDKLTELLKAKPSEVNNRVTKLIEDNKNLEKKISKLESKIIESKIMSLYNDVCDLNDKEGKILVKFLSDINPKFLKDVVMMINNKYPKSIIILAACDETSKKVSVVVKINDMYVSKSIDAKVILNEILEKLNGKGGGKSNYAQGSGIYSNNINLNKILLDIKEKTVAQLF